MKIPKAFGEPVALTAFKHDIKATWKENTINNASHSVVAKTKIKADGEVARWWVEMSDTSKEEYVTEHPNSKYADMHRQSKNTGEPEVPKPDQRPAHINDKAPAGQKKPAPQMKNGQKPHGNGHGAPKQNEKKPGPGSSMSHENEEQAPAVPKKDMAKPGLKDFSHPDMKPGSPKRKAVVSFLKKKTAHVISHLKKDAKEWKTAGNAMKKLATGKPLEAGDKHAMGAVAADIAAVTASILVSGGAAHGLVAFMTHFGTHLAQEAMLKAAVKGAAGHADHGHGAVPHGAPAHASMILTSASEEDTMMEEALKYMMEVLENGNIEELMKKYEAEEKKEPKAAPKKPGVHASSTALTAKLDMSPEHAGKGMCPDCKQQMTIAMVAGVPSYSCVADRISLPLPDDHEYHKQVEAQNKEPLVGY